MRRVQPAKTIDTPEQIGGDALHHAMHLAKNIGVQPAEIGDTRRRPHAAEETIALDQERPPPRPRGRDRRSNPRRSAAEDNDFILAVERNLARGFGD